MADPNFTILDSEDVALAELDGGYVDPGAEKAFEFQYQNTSGKSLTNIVHCPYPGIQNDIHENTVNNPILGIEVIRQSAQGANQTATLAKEDGDSECTAFEQRVKCYEYISGTFTERTTGAVNFMASASDYVIQMCDRKILNTYFNPGTPGSYTGFDIQLWNGSTWFSPTKTDGTSGLSTAGAIRIAAASAASWQKLKLTGTGITSPVTGYPIKYKCTAVTTQAVSAVGGLYWEYAYELPKHFLKGTGEYWLYTASPEDYTQIYPTYEYANLGLIVFQDDPFSGGGDEIRCDIEYKLPQNGLYEIVATGANTVTVEKDSGGASAGIGVQTGLNPITGNYYLNKNVVAGMNVVFDTLAASDAGNFTVSAALRYIDWSDDDSTYYNNDIPLSNMADDQKQTVYGIFSPPMDSQESANEVYFEFFVEGE